MVTALSARFGVELAITYRRRESRAGFKAGNIRDFCERWGADYAFAIVLDADSTMTAAAMLRLVRIMQVEPRIGILQTLVTGLPSASAFARIFQFGMRLGMRSYTLGAATAGRLRPGPGPQRDPEARAVHRALRAAGAPGKAAARRPRVEPRSARSGAHAPRGLRGARAARRGWKLGGESAGADGIHPARSALVPGQTQDFRFLAMPGLKPVSRCQLVLAIAMFLGAPAWLGFIVLGLVRDAPFRSDLGIALFLLMLAMSLAPKAATLADVVARRDSRRAYGGTPRIAASAVLEFALSILIAPVCAVAVTFFVLGLPFGRGVTWNAQQRDAEGLPFRAAARRLWLQTVLGIVLAASCWYVAPDAVWFWAPLIVGLAGAIPIAMLTAHPRAGRALVASGVCRVPEEKVLHEATRDRPRTLASDFEPGPVYLASSERSG